jgi:hypothetical protein
MRGYKGFFTAKFAKGKREGKKIFLPLSIPREKERTQRDSFRRNVEELVLDL